MTLIEQVLPMASEGEADPAGYTIDELSVAARVPSRTIRFYQAKGALMPPEIRGRVAYYGDGHVERLKLIAQLQDRGLRINAIRDLLERIDRGEVALAEWLGVEREVQTSWANDRPKTVSEAELYALVGQERPGLLADLVRAKLVLRTGDVYLIRSPALLAMAMRLEPAGVDFQTAAEASLRIKKHMESTAGDLVKLFLSHAEDGEIDDIGKLLEVLRAIGTDAVRVIFGRAMERALRELLESGKLTKLEARRRERRTRRR